VTVAYARTRATVVTLLAAAAVAAVWLAPARPPNGRRPNVLVLVMDTTRADRCSVTGYGRPTTPRLDEFANDSVVFREAWSPAGWTGPAHASLFTGLRCEHHGFVSGGSRRFVAAGLPTLAELLASAGYATGAFVNNDWISEAFGTARGFERLEPLQARTDRSYPWAAETHAAAASWAEAQARGGRPFFLFINDMEPHLAYTPGDADARPFLRGDPSAEEIDEGRAFDLPQAMAYSLDRLELTPRRLGTLGDLYDAEILSLDREIGALLDRLRMDGLLDSTIVVICGDHGEMLGEHRLFSHGFSLYRAVTRVPLLVRFPGAFSGGRRVDSVVRLEDVMPTVLALCNVPAPPGLDGESLSGDLTGRIALAMQDADPQSSERLAGLAAEVSPDSPPADARALTAGIRSAFDGRFHFLAWSDGRAELYDTVSDPEESRDLAASEPAEVARMTKLLRPAR
jgi:arylsulfatase A-like enzyme